MPITIERDLETNLAFVEVSRFRGPDKPGRTIPVGKWVPLEDDSAICVPGKISGPRFKDLRRTIRSIAKTSVESAAKITNAMREAGIVMERGEVKAGEGFTEDALAPLQEQMDSIDDEASEAIESALRTILAVNYSDTTINEIFDAGLISEDVIQAVINIANGSGTIEVREKEQKN